MPDQLMKLRPQEAALIMTIRRMESGSLSLQIQEGLPVQGNESVRDINFTEKAKDLGYIRE
ncbi:hypothetical protein EDC14_100987 [Hydrogenispora ethanolica]|jgi:hypothetical protein|uniref:Uncharacterized protein n=1 Tax=Hydrogenispora ethanolica TaxID=1082276 RepID=A0A4R1RX65_HYDET|nr:hypothetical protein [Hydrogenispora ethanolica]TCL70770.1 hypothetical protein EDC14_100987 [Hydrogenispora ethanolica]